MPKFRVEITTWGRASKSFYGTIEAATAEEAKDIAFDDEDGWVLDYDQEDCDAEVGEVRSDG